MGKKKHKRAAAGWGQPGYGMEQMAAGMDAGLAGGGLGAGMAPGIAQTMGTPGAGYAAPGMDNGFLHNLQGLVGSRHTEQFIVGALIGAAAVYVLGDEEMRGKLMKGMMKLYASVAGGFEEMKEQMADLKAEVAAEKRSTG